MAMTTSLRFTIATSLLLIGSLLVLQADDKKGIKDPLTEKYAAKEKEIGAALKSGLISKEIAEKILKEYERQLKADQRRGQLRNRQARGAVDKTRADTRARADKAREDALARLEEMRKKEGQADGAFQDARRRVDKVREDARARMEERPRNRGQGEQRKEQFRNGSVAQSDKDGRYLLKIKDGAKHFKVEADGAVIFDGPVDTAEQRKKVKNADLLNKLKPLEAQLVNRAAAFRARWEEIRKNEGQAAFNVRLNALPRWQRQKVQGQAFDPFARQRPGGFNGHNPFKDLDLTDEQQKEIAAIRLKQMEEQLEYSEMMKELDETYQKRMESVLTEQQKEKHKGLQSLRNRR